jgi:protein gp37
MSKNSGIEWTTHTWNTITGCSRISQGCVNCYAEAQSPLLTARYLGTARKHAHLWASTDKMNDLPAHVQASVTAIVATAKSES